MSVILVRLDPPSRSISALRCKVSSVEKRQDFPYGTCTGTMPFIRMTYVDNRTLDSTHIA